MPLLVVLVLFFVMPFSVINVHASEAADTTGASPGAIYAEAKGGNRFHITATGDVEYENAYVIPERSRSPELIWDCSGNALRAGYAAGQMMKPDFEMLVFAVETPVTAGETGTFTMRGITWTYGRESVPGKPADFGFAPARGFEGAGGELRIISHVADKMGEERIQGVAEGEVKSKKGDLSVQLRIEFDLNRKCK